MLSSFIRTSGCWYQTSKKEGKGKRVNYIENFSVFVSRQESIERLLLMLFPVPLNHSITRYLIPWLSKSHAFQNFETIARTVGTAENTLTPATEIYVNVPKAIELMTKIKPALEVRRLRKYSIFYTRRIICPEVLIDT